MDTGGHLKAAFAARIQLRAALLTKLRTLEEDAKAESDKDLSPKQKAFWRGVYTAYEQAIQEVIDA